MTSNFLELKGLYKTFDNITALNNVSLNVSKGEVIFIIGPSGCGKSTLLRAVNWLTPPDKGEVWLEGKLVGSSSSKLTIKEAKLLNNLRAKMGMVFQEFNVWPHLNVLENVVRPQLVVAKRNRATAESKALKILDEVSLHNKIDEWPDHLSGGQKQRLTIARAMLKSPSILILDEATSSLDSESEKKIQDASDKLMLDKTSLIIAHKFSTIKKCDKIILIDKGRIVAEGTHDELINSNSSYKNMNELQM